MEKLGKQQSVEWMMNRVGKVTASRFKDVMAKLASGKPAKARDDYLWEVVIERLTGNPTDHYANAAMQHGIETEPQARMRYEAESGAIVDEVGFLEFRADEAFFGVGGSPDGLIGEDGGLEIKCPFNAAVHLRTVLDGMPPDHMAQVQGLMWITGRKWWDFVSFAPGLPPTLDLYVERIPRDEKFIASLEVEVGLFLADVDALLARLSPAKESAPQAVEAATPDSANTPVDRAPADADPDPYITPDQCANLETACQDAGVSLADFRKAAGVERLSLIRKERYAGALKWIAKQAEA